ncbi:MAG: hypothetical protein ACYS47_10940 [Planctomycetota bacterium]|jgi:hypothetical protein
MHRVTAFTWAGLILGVLCIHPVIAGETPTRERPSLSNLAEIDTLIEGPTQEGELPPLEERSGEEPPVLRLGLDFEAWSPGIEEGVLELHSVFGMSIEADAPSKPRVDLSHAGQIDGPGTFHGGTAWLGFFDRSQPKCGGLLRVHYRRGFWEGEGRLDEPLSLDRFTLPSGSDIDSELEIRYFGLDGAALIPRLWIGRTQFELQLFMGFRVWLLDFDMKTPGGKLDQGGGGFGGAIGYRITFRPFPFLCLTTAGSFSAGIGIPEGQAMVRCSLDFGCVRVDGGYRIFRSWIDTQFYYMQLHIAGFFLGASIRI